MTVVEKRPRLLWLLGLVMFLQGVLYLAYSYQYLRVLQLLVTTTAGWSEHGPGNPQSLISLWLLLSTWVFLGVASLLIAVGLRRRKRSAWAAAMVVEGGILIISLEAYFSGDANLLHYGAMVLAVAIVFMLNQREIQVFYRTSHEREDLEDESEAVQEVE